MSTFPHSLRRSICVGAMSALIFPAAAFSQAPAAQDAPPVDTAQILATLKAIRETHETQTRANKQRAAQQAQALAGNPAGAAAAWGDAIRQATGTVPDPVQDALKETEPQQAARLHFQWMLITLQRANDVEVKDLLPRVIAHTREVAGLRTALDVLQEKINREKEQVGGNKAKSRERQKDDEAAKRLAEDILKASVMAGPVASAWRITEVATVPQWEASAGDMDGIFKSVIIPEMERQRDVRVLEYWDMKVARERERVEKTKDPVQIDRFNTILRPEILWEKAEEANKLGLRNRALSEMMMLIKSAPAHPRFGQWLKRIEEIVAPPAAAPAPTATAAPAAPASVAR
jgi:hypothetical protein